MSTISPGKGDPKKIEGGRALQPRVGKIRGVAEIDLYVKILQRLIGGTQA